ncbi:MAG: tRNA lysidine(34) synthetase TilS [Phascolarctobacterium sp.]|nr:tRNA lysidine(34) synthetase TilS [Phascolarctobacterium sp.]
MQVHPGVKKVYNALKLYIPQGSSLIVAVSGGADSMALADGVAQLANEGYCQPHVLHVEHGLRGAEALADAELVRKFCEAKGLPFTCVHVKVKEYAELHKLSVEEAARKLRYAALEAQAKELKAEYILTAHHSDDQAETVLLKLLRGAGTEGLSGMQVRSGRILRPLLHLTREHLENYCQLQGITYCYDSSNDDVHYTRNKIRRELLPYLESNYNPAVKKALVQSAEILREDDACLNQMAQEKFNVLANCNEIGVVLDVRKWQEVPAALRKRILRQAYFLAGGKELGYRHTEALDVLCLRKTSGKYLQLPQKMLGFYKRGKLSIQQADDGGTDDEGKR